MASGITQKGKDEIASQNLDLVNSANLKLVLVDDTYTFDPNEDFVDAGDAGDVASHEISVSGYTGGFGGGGRRVPANRVLRRDDANGRIEFDFDPETWTSLGSGETIGGVALIEERTSDSDSPVVAFDDLDSDKPTNGGDMQYSPDEEGMLQF